MPAATKRRVVSRRHRAAPDDDTAFRCPADPTHTGGFVIFGAVETHLETHVDAEGNVEETTGGDLEWEEANRMQCSECGYQGTVKEFEKAAETYRV